MEENIDLETRILNWLAKEGYPLEFTVANIFRTNQFATFQGRYVKDFKSNLLREIDVIAQMDRALDESFIRINYLVECKMTKSKPWVIFTDPSARISPGAAISQSIATKLIEALLFYLTQDRRIQELSLYRSPECPGFNGRQAFSDQHDVVYSTLQSIVAASHSEVKEYEINHTDITKSLSFGAMVKPLIVIEGKLFESSFNVDKGAVDIIEREIIRVHWKGSDAWKFHSVVDIITVDYLPKYVSQLYVETRILIDSLRAVFDLLKYAIKTKDVSDLDSLLYGLSSRFHHPLVRQLVGI